MIITAETIPSIITRCGVIPYTILGNTFYFLLSRDAKSGNLADFGGGVKKGERLQPYLAGARECEEESRNIFPDIRNPSFLKDKPALVEHHQKMAIIFYPLDSEWYNKAPKLFNEALPQSKASEEVSEVIWVSLQELQNLVRCKSAEQMWVKIRIFLNNTLLNHRYSIGIKEQLWKALTNYRNTSLPLASPSPSECI